MLDTNQKEVASVTSHRERDDSYHRIIYSNPSWRVITCKDGIQWIIQRSKKAGAGLDWRSASYHTTKKGLIRVWHSKSNDYHGAVALGSLPERIGGEDYGH